MKEELSEHDYKRLLEFRTGLRRFLRWSEERAAGVGITPAQHQLMLAIRGHAEDHAPTVGDVANALLLRHHSTVGLVDRAVEAGLVERRPDTHDHRVVRLHLTPLGLRRIKQLSEQHLDELRRMAPRMRSLWTDLDASSSVHRGT